MENDLKRALARIGMLLAVAVPVACSHGSSQSSGSASAVPSGGKTIGVSIQNREAQFYQDMESGNESEAAKYGYTVDVVDASRDNAKQQSQVEDFISQKVDAIVLTPYDSQAIGSAIVEANKAGIPVFTADIANTSRVGHGRLAHRQRQRPGRRAGRQADVRGGRQARQRRDHRRARGHERPGPRQGLQRGPCAELSRGDHRRRHRRRRRTRDKATRRCEDILQSHNDLKGIFGINDDSALGASPPYRPPA